MTKQADIFNPSAPDHIGDANKMVSGLEAYAKRPGSGVMSEAQWQAWMGRVADRMRRMAAERQGNHG